MAYKLSKLYVTAAGPHYGTVCERSEFKQVWDYAIEMFQACSLNIVGCHYDPGADHTEAPQSAEFFVAAPGIHETYVIQAN
jgi:hypothetical protein